MAESCRASSLTPEEVDGFTLGHVFSGCNTRASGNTHNRRCFRILDSEVFPKDGGVDAQFVEWVMFLLKEIADVQLMIDICGLTIGHRTTTKVQLNIGKQDYHSTYHKDGTKDELRVSTNNDEGWNDGTRCFSRIQSNDISQEQARESLIAISYTSPEEVEDSLTPSDVKPVVTTNTNGVAKTNSEAAEKLRSELISISYDESPSPSPDVTVSPTLPNGA
ncbi:hypothetical protein Bca101_055594 [Brassica carinata]